MIFPAKIRHSCSGGALNFFDSSSLNWKLKAINFRNYIIYCKWGLRESGMHHKIFHVVSKTHLLRVVPHTNFSMFLWTHIIKKLCMQTPKTLHYLQFNFLIFRHLWRLYIAEFKFVRCKEDHGKRVQNCVTLCELLVINLFVTETKPMIFVVSSREPKSACFCAHSMQLLGSQRFKLNELLTSLTKAVKSTSTVCFSFVVLTFKEILLDSSLPSAIFASWMTRLESPVPVMHLQELKTNWSAR